MDVISLEQRPTTTNLSAIVVSAKANLCSVSSDKTEFGLFPPLTTGRRLNKLFLARTYGYRTILYSTEALTRDCLQLLVLTFIQQFCCHDLG